MQQVVLASLPGIAVLTGFFGWGTVVNVLWAITVAVGCEAAVLKLRKRPVLFYLNDYSAVVTAVLLGIALPPYAPWWLILVGASFALLFAKHLYGGMGYNPFNPAMAGYVLLLISFPIEMTSWAAPANIVAGQPEPLGLVDSLLACFGFLAMESIDVFTMATPLDVFKHANTMLVNDVWAQNPQFGSWGGVGWEWANLFFLAGGLYLLWRRVFTWHAPISMLVTLTLLALFFYDGGSSASKGSPLMHLLSGGTMLGAFFIVTDPVTSATSNRGKLVYGICIGILTFVIRAWGNYPDAIAFSVLLMNFAAPFIDHYTQPKTYGHQRGKGS
jgi:electron transport complex protein RnfD